MNERRCGVPGALPGVQREARVTRLPFRAIATRRLRCARRAHAALGHQLGRDEAGADERPSDPLQHRAHVGCHRGAVRGPAFPAPSLCCRNRGPRSRSPGFFQTTVNMGSTTMAVADGGAGRAAVLVFTMPFWTVLLAWPVLGERVRGIQWIAVCPRARRAYAGRRAVGVARRVEVQGVGRAVRVRLGVRDDRHEALPAHAAISTCSISSPGRCCSVVASAVPPSARAAIAGDVMERDLRRPPAVDRRARFRARVRAVGRRAALSHRRHRVAQHAGDPGHRAPVVDGDFRRAPLDERMDRHRLHRRRSRRHLVPRVAREPPRRAAASCERDAARRRRDADDVELALRLRLASGCPGARYRIESAAARAREAAGSGGIGLRVRAGAAVAVGRTPGVEGAAGVGPSLPTVARSSSMSTSSGASRTCNSNRDVGVGRQRESPFRRPSRLS